MDAEKATVALKEVKAFWTQQFKTNLNTFYRCHPVAGLPLFVHQTCNL